MMMMMMMMMMMSMGIMTVMMSSSLYDLELLVKLQLWGCTSVSARTARRLGKQMDPLTRRSWVSLTLGTLRETLLELLCGCTNLHG